MTILGYHQPDPSHSIRVLFNFFFLAHAEDYGSC